MTKENVIHGEIRMADGSTRYATSTNGVVRFALDRNANSSAGARFRTATVKQAETFFVREAGQAARTAEAIMADGATPAAAAQQAQLEAWIASHHPLTIAEAIAADEVDAGAADGFMSANPLPDALGGPAGQSPDPVIGGRCFNEEPHPKHIIAGTFRGGCPGIPAPAARGFKVGDRVFGGVWGRPQHEYRVREISETGSLRLQVVGGPGLPLWVLPATAVAWARVEAERDQAGNAGRVVEVADGHVVHECCGKVDEAHHKNFCPKFRVSVDGPVVRDETPAATVAGYTVHAFHRRLRGDMASAVGACGGQGWRGSAALVNCVDCLTGGAAGLNIGHAFVEAAGVLPGEGLCQQAMPAGDLCGERVTALIHVGGVRVVMQPAQPPPVVGVVDPSPTVPALSYGEQYGTGLREVDVTDEAEVAIDKAEDAFTAFRVALSIRNGSGGAGRVPEGWLLTQFSAAELATAVASGFVRRQGGFAYLLNQDGSLAVQPYVQAPACRPVVAARLGRNSASAQWGQQDELLGKLRRLASNQSVAVDAAYYVAVGRVVQPHAELPPGFRRAEIGGPGTIYPL